MPNPRNALKHAPSTRAPSGRRATGVPDGRSGAGHDRCHGRNIHEAPEIAAGKLVAINGVLRERFGIDPATVQTEHGGYAHGPNCGGHHIQAV
jgi:hypothetical protein